MTIFCVGRNYLEHAVELNNPVPLEPVIFCKPHTALLRENKAFYIPNFSKDIHYEVEVVLKICKNGKAIPIDKAGDYYSHIGLGIDFTARDIQKRCKEKGLPWEIAKGFDGSAVLSDWIARDDLKERSIAFSLKKNNELVQQGDTKDLLFSFEKIISYLSEFFRLNNGDIIYTGTPAGVGPVSIGDQLEGFINDQRMFVCQIK
ncbi:MAG: fumarylacetoacetate hydrolase family protein [Bacteroidota bacterium]|nr:fumarylacetoacetate hydrolase family protein [Bacteroidota bacterium]